MGNGHAEEVERVALTDSLRFPDNDDNLSLVIKAVEAAETTIKHQKSDESLPQTSNLRDHSNATTVSGLVHQPCDWKQSVINADSSGIVVVDPRMNANDEEATVSNGFESHSEENIINGIVRETIDGAGPCQFESSYERSLSPMRMQLGEEHVAHIHLSTHGSKPVGEVNHSDNAWKQELIHKVHQNEQEIFHLRNYLTECSVKEAQIRNEKYVLEKRIAYMRLVFDQQQQDQYIKHHDKLFFNCLPEYKFRK